ncbi:MAGa3780 family membrane protein [Mycoplasmopsis canis]|uniref:MAGa3780 family membrane protein n=1 Tax=Mycoplasmopsis canis TaxID=29555 RepID=UPI00025ADA22|nr:hypothetical protein [Mycoplasmopsis canis]EIE40653.1 hypothetical protein MCANUF33_00833 [Mycoplasmopsis canis UF33]
MFKKIVKKIKQWNLRDWTTFFIGLILINLYIFAVFWNWYDESRNIWLTYNKNPDIIAKINELARNATTNEEKGRIYLTLLPNATESLWGGTSYFYTFISNVLMGSSIMFFPFFKNTKLGQRLYFGSIVFIISVVLGFWGGVLVDKELLGKMKVNDFPRTLIWHAIAPGLGILTLFWQRKNIRISNKVIWSLSIYPIIYSIFMVAIYMFGYKFMNLHKEAFLPDFYNINDPNNPIPQEYNSEIERGIVFYSIISILKPFGYSGDNNYVRIVLLILITLFMIMMAPTIGFIVRKFWRIKQPNQKSLPKLIFIDKDSKIKAFFEKRKNKNIATNK